MGIPTQIQPTNPFGDMAAGVAEGNKSGNEWAHTAAQVTMQSQQLKQQQTQLEEMKRQFEVGVGKTLYDMTQDAVTELPGPVKESKIKSLQTFAEQSGRVIDPTQLASMKDENYKPAYQSFFKGMGAADPEASAHFFEGFGTHMGRKASMEMLEKATSALGMLNSAKLRASGIQGLTEAKTEMSAQDQSNKVMNQFVPRLEGAARMMNLMKDMQSGKVKTNAAGKNLIIAEQRRLETGANNPAYEGQVQQEMRTKREQLGEILQNWTGNPQDSVPKGIMDQLKALQGGFQTQYMDQANSAFEVLKAGARPEQLSIFKAKHEALQRNYRKRFGYFGSEEQAAQEKGKPGTDTPTLDTPKSGTIQQAALVGKAYRDETNPTKKALILQRAKAHFGDDILDQAGLK